MWSRGEHGGAKRLIRFTFGRRQGERGLLLLAVGAVVLSTGCAEVEGPEPLAQASPVEYPAELWDQGVEGVVTVRALVGADGGVDSVDVDQGSGVEALDQAALEGIRSMRFSPAHRRGEPLSAWVRVPVHFSLDRDVSSPPAPDGPSTGNPEARRPQPRQDSIDPAGPS